jgi:membrane protein YdbS with pleckstrin-like domain
MAELEIRPTLRFIRLGYVAVTVLLAAALAWWAIERTPASVGAIVVAALLFAWPLIRHLKRQRIRCRLEGENLRYEEGLLSTTVKTLPVANIQDVTVQRGLMQRLWRVGNLRIDTTGHGDPIEIANVEDPQPLADRILAARGTRK